MRTPLPKSGTDWDSLQATMSAYAEDDVDWRAGRTAVYIFNAGEDVLRVAKDAYGMFMSENGLGAAKAFPSLRRMETDVVDFGLGLLNAPEEAVGNMTSGGTESILMAAKTCRDWWHAQGRDVAGAEILAPQSAHPAFDKAAALLGLTVVRIPVRSDFQADVAAMENAATDRTIMLVGSAPCFPYGVIDPIAELGALADAKELWLHVDACVGGYFAPFARMNGSDLPAFDFEVPAVRSISADLHKYGYAAKGASTVFYRDASLREHQVFTFSGWPCGTMVTPTLAGTRPGGAIAAAWAVMNYLGVDGYRAKARAVIQAREALCAGIAAIDGLCVWGEPKLGLMTFGSDEADIFAVADIMAAKGWVSARINPPPGIHLMLSPAHLATVDDYLSDLRDAAARVRRNDLTSQSVGGSYN